MGTLLDPEYPPLLPAGLHDCDEADLEARFVSPFPGSKTRPEIASRLRAFLVVLRQLGLSGTLWLDGSFLTEKVDPDDVDVVLLVADAVLQTLDPKAFDTFQRMVQDRNVVLIRFLCDLYYCDPDNELMRSYWRGWFGFDREEKVAKGIARVAL